MICCDFCPNVMHAACCGIDDPSALGSMWSCPHHKCVTCGRKAYAAGGLLFRCSECPKVRVRVRVRVRARARVRARVANPNPPSP